MSFQLYSIQCIKSAKISLKWTVSHLYCQLAFQPFKCSECITMEKITEAWASMWAFKVLFIISQFWLLFFLFRKATYLLYHCLVIVTLPCPLLPYFPLSSHFIFCLPRHLQTQDYVFMQQLYQKLWRSPPAYRHAAPQWIIKCYGNVHLTGHPTE